MERDFMTAHTEASDSIGQSEMAREVLRRFLLLIGEERLTFLGRSLSKGRQPAEWSILKALGLVDDCDDRHTVSIRVEAPVSEGSDAIASFDAARLSVIAIVPDRDAAIAMAVNCPNFFLREGEITFTGDYLREPMTVEVPMTEAIEIARECVSIMGGCEGPVYGPQAADTGKPGRCALAAT